MVQSRARDFPARLRRNVVLWGPDGPRVGASSSNQRPAPSVTPPVGAMLGASAAMTCLGEIPRARAWRGSISTTMAGWGPQTRVPTTPGAASEASATRRPRSWRSRAGSTGERRVTSATVGGSCRAMVGGVASCGSADLIAKSRARRHSLASVHWAPLETPKTTCPDPDSLALRTRLTPAHEAAALSHGITTSRCTASGEAPG